jgi:hypothetical protein
VVPQHLHRNRVDAPQQRLVHLQHSGEWNKKDVFNIRTYVSWVFRYNAFEDARPCGWPWPCAPQGCMARCCQLHCRPGVAPATASLLACTGHLPPHGKYAWSQGIAGPAACFRMQNADSELGSAVVRLCAIVQLTALPPIYCNRLCMGQALVHSLPTGEAAALEIAVFTLLLASCSPGCAQEPTG